MMATGVGPVTGMTGWVVGPLLLATACGGADSARVNTNASAVTPTTSGPTATTEAANPADPALAVRGVLVKADLPPDWVEHTKGTGLTTTVTAASRLGCSLPKGQPGELPWAVGHDGGIYQKA